MSRTVVKIKFRDSVSISTTKLPCGNINDGKAWEQWGTPIEFFHHSVSFLSSKGVKYESLRNSVLTNISRLKREKLQCTIRTWLKLESNWVEYYWVVAWPYHISLFNYNCHKTRKDTFILSDSDYKNESLFPVTVNATLPFLNAHKFVGDVAFAVASA